MIWEFADNNLSGVRDALRVFGFAMIRNVLDRDEVQLVRSELDRAFGSAHLRDMPTLFSTRDAQARADLENPFQRTGRELAPSGPGTRVVLPT